MKTQQQIEKEVLEIAKDPALTYKQRTDSLAKFALSFVEAPEGVPEEYFRLAETGDICDLTEGYGEVSARYILPDFEKFLKEGSAFLDLKPAKTLLQATTNLLIFYNNAHCLDRYPVFLGRLDMLLEPYVKTMDYEDAKEIIRNFMLCIDRTMSDSFVQANLGPEETITGNIILELLVELQNATPNVTLRYNPDTTPDSFATKALVSALKSANPAFAYDPFYKERVGENYGIASCYNGLLIRGGAFTLTRLRLATIALHSEGMDDFFNHKLPEAINAQLGFMDAKIKNLVENRAFFSDDWMFTDGFVDADKFVGLFGLVGLCDCVNFLYEKEGESYRFGPDKEANMLGVRILDIINEAVENHYCPYSYNHRFVMHSQVGTGLDTIDSAGTRIRVGQEMDLYPHLKQAGLYHKYFPSGVGDIFPFDYTALKNPEALLDIFKGAFKVGIKYMSTYLADGDLVRVSGYLVKKSEVEKFMQGKMVKNASASLVPGQQANNHIFDRKVRSL